MKYLKNLDKEFETFVDRLDKFTFDTNIKEIDEPLRYFLDIGGKRFRPYLCLFTNNWYGEVKDFSYNIAIALELFHNFTLIHDDIMDKSDKRRNMQTIHTKWNQEIAILSGDYLLIEAYNQICQCPENRLKSMLYWYNKMGKELCIGQQMDMNFENEDTISLDEYMKMIRYKTGSLLGFAMVSGAIAGGAKEEELHLLYELGQQLGLYFQIQDDILDTYGDDRVGKKIGGDIYCGKKTCLYILCYESLKGEVLDDFISEYKEEDKDKLNKIISIFDEAQVPKKINNLLQTIDIEIGSKISFLNLPKDRKQEFDLIMNLLKDRKS